MSIRTLLIVAAVAALATGLAILAIDAPAARALAEVDPAAAPVRALDEILALLDEITLVRQPRGRLAAVLIVVGGLAWWWHRGLARAALVLGLTHAISRVGGSYLKEMFGRLRPGEALEAGRSGASFFQDGGFAFPSGHLGHYGALAFAVAVLWPRARIPALVVLGVVALARIVPNAHWISDVTGAIALAALGAAFSAALVDRLSAAAGPTRRRPGASAPPRA